MNPCVFLAGDAAHRVPPSGGFGMNAGFSDAFNLAHKIKANEECLTSNMLNNYEKERLHANKLYKEFSIKNY